MRGDVYRAESLGGGTAYYFGKSLALVIAEAKANARPTIKTVVVKLSPGKQQSVTWVSD